MTDKPAPVDHEAATRYATEWKVLRGGVQQTVWPGELGTLARAYLALRAEVEALTKLTKHHKRVAEAAYASTAAQMAKCEPHLLRLKAAEAQAAALRKALEVMVAQWDNILNEDGGAKAALEIAKAALEPRK